MAKTPLKVDYSYKDLPKRNPYFFILFGTIVLAMGLFILIQSYSQIGSKLEFIIILAIILWVDVYAIKCLIAGYNLLKKKKGSIQNSKKLEFEQYSIVKSWKGYYISGLISIIVPIIFLLIFLRVIILNELGILWNIIASLICLLILYLGLRTGSSELKIAKGLKRGDKTALKEAKKHPIFING